jgi:hypothetical protein
VAKRDQRRRVPVRSLSQRCQLGVDVYLVSTEPALGAARRLVPGTTEFVAWTGKPIEPLGGLTIEIVEGEVMVRTPDGHVFSEDSELYGRLLFAETAAR